MGNHMCHINRNGKIKCWGNNNSGQLGLGDTSNRGDDSNEMGSDLPFVKIGNGMRVDQVAVGIGHTCAHFTSNQIKCWGSNLSGVLGLGIDNSTVGAVPEETPDKIDFLNLGSVSHPIQVACGQVHTCVLFNNKKVKCFGSNEYGQLAWEGVMSTKGRLSSDMGDNLPFIEIGTGIGVESIHSNLLSMHNCIVTATTQLMKCWGYNSYYQLGYGDTVHRGQDTGTLGDNLITIDLGTEDRVKMVSLGAFYTCALRVDDVLKCWGSNGNGQLGIGSSDAIIDETGTALASTPYDSGKKIKQIVSGNDNLCILYDDNLTVKCVGNNANGQLGQGDTNSRGSTLETTFPNISAINLGSGSLNISMIRSLSSSNCVFFIDNSAKCFGFGAFGELGSGSKVNAGDFSDTSGEDLPFSVIFELSNAPTTTPTKAPTNAPTLPTNLPTKSPTNAPIAVPTNPPVVVPTSAPIVIPTTKSPTKKPTESAIQLTNSPTSTIVSEANINVPLAIGLGVSLPLVAIIAIAGGYYFFKNQAKKSSPTAATTYNQLDTGNAAP